MPDRSDDIKQLFSHLGLNPGQYHELQERTRAVAPPAAPVKPAAAAPEPTRVAPPSPPAPLPVPAFVAPAPAPPAAAPAPMPAPVPVATAAPIAPPVPPPPVRPAVATTRTIVEPPATQRRAADPGWPLIRAAQETPTRVAQVSPAVPPAESTGSTRRLIDELARQRAGNVTERLVDGASRRWRDPAPVAAASVAPPAAPPAPQTTAAPVFKAPLPTQATRPPEPTTPAVAPPEPVTRLAPDSDLAQTFMRIGQPERTPLKRDARLRFSYDIHDDVSRTRKLKEENLEQVFDRLSGLGSKSGPDSE